MTEVVELTNTRIVPGKEGTLVFPNASSTKPAVFPNTFFQSVFVRAASCGSTLSGTLRIGLRAKGDLADTSTFAEVDLAELTSQQLVFVHNSGVADFFLIPRLVFFTTSDQEVPAGALRFRLFAKAQNPPCGEDCAKIPEPSKPSTCLLSHLSTSLCH